MARQKKVFISYRREDAADIAGRMRDWLIGSAGVRKEDVFLDVTNILPGAAFMKVVSDTINRCDAVIVVISPSWLTLVNTDATAYVKQEAEIALQQGKQLIPVLVSGATIEQTAQLPPALRPLQQLNIRPIRADSFDYDMAAVARSLRLSKRSPLGIVAALLLGLILLVGIATQTPLGNPIRQIFHVAPTPDQGKSTSPNPAATSTNVTAATIPPTATTPPPVASNYSAKVPGPGCDTAGGAWFKRDGDNSTELTCQSDSLLMTRITNANKNAILFFEWPNHPFPQNYSIATTISNLTTGTCAGVKFRIGSEQGRNGYEFLVCQDGSWQMLIASDAGNLTALKTGTVAASPSYPIQIVAKGADLTFNIGANGGQSVTDATNTTTVNLALIVSNDAGGSAHFAKFQYMPLP